MPFTTPVLSKHRWFSGRMLACHAGGPGSIPGQCSVFGFFYHFYTVTKHIMVCHAQTRDRGNVTYFSRALLPGESFHMSYRSSKSEHCFSEKGWLQTDRQTDRQTDGHYLLRSARKKALRLKSPGIKTFLLESCGVYGWDDYF